MSILFNFEKSFSVLKGEMILLAYNNITKRKIKQNDNGWNFTALFIVGKRSFKC